MRMLHWSSISFGYMKPWTCARIVCSMAFSLPHRAVEAVVVGLRAGRHLGLQPLDLLVADERVDRVLRVLEIAERPRAGRAGLAARCRQPLGDPVVAEAALVDGVGLRVDVPAAVRAGLD